MLWLVYTGNLVFLFAICTNPSRLSVYTGLREWTVTNIDDKLKENETEQATVTIFDILNAIYFAFYFFLFQ